MDTSSVYMGYGFTNEQPYVLIDDLSCKPTQRKKVFLHKNCVIEIQTIGNKFCLGQYQLMTQERIPCPNQASIELKKSNCYSCFQSVGFTPSFNRSSRLSPQQQIYCQQPHLVYLAAFGAGIIKVGTAFIPRTPERWLEQGAKAVAVVQEYKNAYDARDCEIAIRDGNKIKEGVRVKEKISALTKEWDFIKEQDQLSRLRREIQQRLQLEVQDLPIRDLTTRYGIDFPIDGIANGDEGSSCEKGKFIGLIGELLILESENRCRYFRNIKNFVGSSSWRVSK